MWPYPDNAANMLISEKTEKTKQNQTANCETARWLSKHILMIIIFVFLFFFCFFQPVIRFASARFGLLNKFSEACLIFVFLFFSPAPYTPFTISLPLLRLVPLFKLSCKTTTTTNERTLITCKKTKKKQTQKIIVIKYYFCHELLLFLWLKQQTVTVCESHINHTRCA